MSFNSKRLEHFIKSNNIIKYTQKHIHTQTHTLFKWQPFNSQFNCFSHCVNWFQLGFKSAVIKVRNNNQWLSNEKYFESSSKCVQFHNFTPTNTTHQYTNTYLNWISKLSKFEIVCVLFSFWNNRTENCRDLPAE